jgi:glycosyltransferase involved in cell wall biosynthesis
MINPTISVVIPLYNRKDYIIPTIESIRKQTYQPLEIIIIDDHSTDGGPALVEEYSKQNQLNVFIFKNTCKRGVSGARNAGVEHSKGDYIAFQDSDDIWLPDHLKRIRDAIVKTKAEVISSDFSFFGIKELCDFNISFFKRLKKRMLNNGFELIGDNQYLSDSRLLQAALSGGFSLRVQSTAVQRKSFHEHNVWFDENLSFLEDHHFYLECTYKRLSMAYVDQIGVMIRKYRDDTHYDKIESHKYRMQKMIREFDCKMMNVQEEDLFHRAVHEMGFMLIKGELAKEEFIKGETKKSNVLQRIVESAKFICHFPTNRGLREAVKNIIGDMPSRLLVCLLKGKPYEPKNYLMDPVIERHHPLVGKQIEETACP